MPYPRVLSPLRDSHSIVQAMMYDRVVPIIVSSQATRITIGRRMLVCDLYQAFVLHLAPFRVKHRPPLTSHRCTCSATCYEPLRYYHLQKT